MRDFLDVSRYYTQIIPYIRKFGREAVMIIDFDDLVSRRDMVLERVADLLEVDSSGFGNIGCLHSNASMDQMATLHQYDRPGLMMRAVRAGAPWAWKRITDNSARRFKSRPVLAQESREMIVRVLELEVRELEKLMNKDFSAWLST